MKVLLVDDEQLQLLRLNDAVKKVLPDAEIFSYNNPMKALEETAETPLDLAFLDIEMPGLNGIQLAKKLKTKYPLIKVKEIYSLVCGLGYLFSVNTLKVKLIRTFCGLGYKWALSKNNKVVFQNQDDIDEFTRRGYVKKEKCELVNGSGVNLEKFTRNDIPTD